VFNVERNYLQKKYFSWIDFFFECNVTTEYTTQIEKEKKDKEMQDRKIEVTP
jgi:hypothetical protein